MTNLAEAKLTTPYLFEKILNIPPDETSEIIWNDYIDCCELMEVANSTTADPFEQTYAIYADKGQTEQKSEEVLSASSITYKRRQDSLVEVCIDEPRLPRSTPFADYLTIDVINGSIEVRRMGNTISTELDRYLGYLIEETAFNDPSSLKFTAPLLEIGNIRYTIDSTNQIVGIFMGKREDTILSPAVFNVKKILSGKRAGVTSCQYTPINMVLKMKDRQGGLTTLQVHIAFSAEKDPYKNSIQYKVTIPEFGIYPKKYE